MSVSTEVQRTLVKSPPELWAELSDPEALTRHLAELGEIRITRVEPETKVEWEADGASGVVQLKPSGWGTKVTLSVTRNPPVADAPIEPELVAVVEPEPVVEPESIVEPEPVVEPEPEPVAEQAAPEPEPPVPEPEPPVVEQPKPHRGFLARLFRRRNAAERAPVPVEPEPGHIAVAKPEPEFEALAAPEPIYPARSVEPAVDLNAELASMEAQMAQETTELLTGVLDRLGAAHHRPFSRG